MRRLAYSTILIPIVALGSSLPVLAQSSGGTVYLVGPNTKLELTPEQKARDERLRRDTEREIQRLGAHRAQEARMRVEMRERAEQARQSQFSRQAAFAKEVADQQARAAAIAEEGRRLCGEQGICRTVPKRPFRKGLSG